MNPSSGPLHTLDLDPAQLFRGGNLIIIHEKGEKHEPPIDGSFILQLLISEYNQPKSTRAANKILLILTHQAEKHWSQCCGKFGQNLDTLKGKFDFVFSIFECEHWT